MHVHTRVCSMQAQAHARVHVRGRAMVVVEVQAWVKKTSQELYCHQIFQQDSKIEVKSVCVCWLSAFRKEGHIS